MLSKLQKSVFSATLTYSSSSKKNPKNNLGKKLRSKHGFIKGIYVNLT